MILAINGKIGAGKDTVGKIIQFLTTDYGSKGLRSFESSLGKTDNEGFGYAGFTGYNSPWEVKKFAKKLKEIASILTGIPIEKFEDQEFKKTFLGEEWSYSEDGKGHYVKGNVTQMTVRELLQKVGTEAMRNGLHTNVWVNALFADYKGVTEFNSTIHTKNNSFSFYPNWLITDLRFSNEFQTVKERNGICIRVNRPLEFVDQDAFDAYKKGLHLSETALDQHIFDWEIENDGNIENLVGEVRKMLINFKII